MSNPIVAIGLDAAAPELLETWMSRGDLPTLERLREQGGYGRLVTREFYRSETAWTTFLTGCFPEKTGYWGRLTYDGSSYDDPEIGTYDFIEFPLFYALGDDYRVAIMDMPQANLSDKVNGVQVLAGAPTTTARRRVITRP
jgi:predicted AlkP superfamily phosphohydrolase/phosphomutase